MSDRLGHRDLALLSVDSPATPMHNASVEIFDPGEVPFDYSRLASLVADRIAFVPRYRQRLQTVPGRVANPVWVDDLSFDLAFHVRRSALPRPGNLDQLRDLVARVVSRPLDRNRPLWEVYVIEGLEGGRVALLTKSHQILVDGVETVDLMQVLLDTSPATADLGHDLAWHPRGTPSALGLVAGAVHDSLQHPSTLLDTVRGNLGSLARTAGAVGGRLGAVVPSLPGPLPGRGAAGDGPLSTRLSQQRRFTTARTDLADYRRVRRTHGGTVNDVILATVTGGLRGWLMTRKENVAGARQLRAMVPMSVIDDDLEPTSLGTQITGHLVTLPVGEPSAVVRLHQVGYAFQAHKETRRAVSARRLAGIAGFAPSTFHALGSRVAATEQRHPFDLTVTNVPGPQFPLYAAGAKMVGTYPLHPLLPGHALAIGVTSYDGGVYYGITADRDAVPDVDVLAQCILEALDELLDTTTDARARAPRGRPAPGATSRAAGRATTTRTSGRTPRRPARRTPRPAPRPDPPEETS